MSAHAYAPPQLFVEGSVSGALKVAAQDGPLNTGGLATASTPGVKDAKHAARDLRERLGPCLAGLHDRLMAENERAVLVVLQGLDGSGKSGTVKHVAASLNPVGVRVTSFKAPEGEEKDEPFLDRIRRQLPAPGQIAFFDRSYVEDAIVPLALGELTDDAVDERIGEINEFESELKKHDIVLVKCFLHLSYDEQRERFLRRLRRPDKHWKFSEADIDTRQLWPEFQMAYGRVIGRTNRSLAPWFAVPSDHKWYRNWAVASLLAEHLAAMAPEYPAFTIDADTVRQRLAAPN